MQIRRPAVVLLGLLAGCEEGGGLTTGPGPGPGPGPSTPPTLSADVQPIFNNNCAFNGCHGGAILEPADRPMDLSAGSSRASTVGVESVQNPGMDRIAPGDPDASYLVHKIQGTQAAVGGSGSRMPKGLPALAPAEIDIIRDWIEDGARDN